MQLAYTHAPYIWMDPRSKVMLFIAANVSLWAGINLASEVLLMLMIILLLINARMLSLALIQGALFFTFIMLDLFVAQSLSGVIGVVFLTIVRVFRIYMPIMLSALYLIRTTKVSEFVAAFSKIHMTEKVVIPFCVMFRFFPTLAEEWQNINNAMKFRGIRISFKNVIFSPIKTLEYVFVPLLMSTSKIASDLTAASLSRGLEANGERTCLQQISFGILDYTVVLLSVALSLYNCI